MKRLLGTILTVLLLAVTVEAAAQTIQNASYQTVGYIKSDGTIQDKSYRTVGYIKSNGTVQDASSGPSDMSRTTGLSRTGTIAQLATRRASHANGPRSISSSKSKINTI